jgi:hypothetical protein
MLEVIEYKTLERVSEHNAVSSRNFFNHLFTTYSSSMSILSPTWLSDGKQDAGTMKTSWIINRSKHAVDVIPGMM